MPLPPLPATPRTDDPKALAKALDSTNLPRPIMLVAHGEADGTLTLVLQATGTGETVPLVLGSGFRSIEDVTQAVMQALVAPAVAEDRLQVVEEAASRVNQLIDAVNELTSQVADQKVRIEYLEQMTGRAGIPLTRPLIPRLGERPRQPYAQPEQPPRGQYHDLRNAWDGAMEPAAPAQQAPQPAQPPSRKPPAPRQPSQEPRPVVNEGPRPDFSRGSFQPHQPVGRVSRGPGSPDNE
ncbi:MAG: hypothetical protein DMF56_27065 [Acidobacteria bacterium]|nr:MAG: hypothetical protein DMF56_27065 [Acidobacteriota bacterium]